MHVEAMIEQLLFSMVRITTMTGTGWIGSRRMRP